MKIQYQRKNILIIKFGGLGDFFLSLRAFHAIRKHHIEDRLILLTEKQYYKIAESSGWFDDIKLIKRSLFYFIDRINIKKIIRIKDIDYVYDLQTSKRSSSYFKLFNLSYIRWSGIANNCSHPHVNPNRNSTHTTERLRDQLKDAGIIDYPNVNFSWLIKGIKKNNFKNYAIIIPGGSGKREYKRIPVCFFNKIIKILTKKKIYPILVGAKDDVGVCEKIIKENPKILNLCCKITIFELAELGKKSRIVIGNDTGPMHLMAMMDCLTLSLFTKYSNPDICAPKGKNVKVFNVKNYNETCKNIEKIINNC